MQISKIDDNPFISFYGKHYISPVRQDLSNFDLFLQRREKLFTTIGIPTLLLSGRRILEVGPGGGYNSLAFFKWGAVVDFVEPNSRAHEELYEILLGYGIREWNLHNCMIESFNTETEYDLVIAEGFIHGVNNKREVISKLKSLVRDGGIIVITCVDDISCFFEILKRLIGAKLIYVKGVTDFHNKVDILVQAFYSHFYSLKHASRFIEDYIMDNFLNPSLYTENLFSMGECLEEFADTFKLLGCSPSMFTEYSWYKDIEYNPIGSALKQFYEKRHLLMLYTLQESVRPVKDNEYLFIKAFEFRHIAGELEREFYKDSPDEGMIRFYMNKIIQILEEICDITQNIHPHIPDAIHEAIDLLTDRNINEIKISRAHEFAKAFGRTQQYMSFVKRHTCEGKE